MAIETVNIRDSYKWYKENAQHPKVHISIYMKIATGFMKFLAKKIVAGFQVQLGNAHSLGVFAVVGKKVRVKIDEETGKVRGLMVNWKATNELWASNPELRRKEYVYYTNDHTNGVKYNLVWWKTNMNIGNKHLYSFTFCKPLRKELSASINEGKEYLVYN